MMEGSCLCGAVRFAIDGPVSPLQYCHCRDCRKTSGGAFIAAVAIVPAGSLDGQPELTPFRHIFVSLNPPWYKIRDDLPQFAQHVPPEQRLPTKERDRA